VRIAELQAEIGNQDCPYIKQECQPLDKTNLLSGIFSAWIY